MVHPAQLHCTGAASWRQGKLGCCLRVLFEKNRERQAALEVADELLVAAAARHCLCLESSSPFGKAIDYAKPSPISDVC
jgi:hypothetical protein